QEDGIDISHHTSNHVDEYRDVVFDYVITVCDHAREHCPFFPARIQILHHSFPDPARAEGDPETIMTEFRKVRDQIKAYCLDFVHQHIPASSEKP
ncbi:MAG: arsenate reductase ArsC, partial [Thermoflavifilum aggregans]|nr:arsenate reductase ArsC [Thermoflavifilum aggregans]